MLGLAGRRSPRRSTYLGAFVSCTNWPPSAPTEAPDILTIDIRCVGRRAVVRVAGEIDIATGPRLRAALDQAAGAAPLEVWVDLSDVRFMDSTGLNALLDLAGRVPRVAVICPEGNVRRTFDIAGLADAFPLYSTRAQAQYAA
jgi:anti-sigma B factor antagonist